MLQTQVCKTSVSSCCSSCTKWGRNSLREESKSNEVSSSGADRTTLYQSPNTKPCIHMQQVIFTLNQHKISNNFSVVLPLFAWLNTQLKVLIESTDHNLYEKLKQQINSVQPHLPQQSFAVNLHNFPLSIITVSAQLKNSQGVKDGLTKSILVHPGHLMAIYLPDLQWHKDS